MKKRRTRLVQRALVTLGAVMLASLACGRTTERIEDSVEPTSARTLVTQPASSSQPTAAPPTETVAPAEPVEFKAIPFAAIKSQFDPRGREAEAGWSYLYVLIALENVSDRFARLACCNPNVGTQVVTGEGYTYKAEGEYLGTNTLLVPPGYRMWAVKFPQHYNYFVFKVAEQTNRYELHIPDLAGFSPVWLDDVPSDMTESDFERLGLSSSPIAAPVREAIRGNTSLDLDKLFSPSPSAAEALEKGDTFRFGDSGELTVVSSEWQDEKTLMVNMLFANTSGGYSQEFPYQFHVFGENGVMWQKQNSPAGPFEVGPGQEAESQRRFLIEGDAGDLKFVIEPERGVELTVENVGFYNLD